MAKVYKGMSVVSCGVPRTRVSSPQKVPSARPRMTLHYLPIAKQELLLGREDNELYSPCEGSLSVLGIRDMDSVDEDALTKLCYAFGLDKLYELPDLQGAEILNKI